jgi:hypothetical protein
MKPGDLFLFEKSVGFYISYVRLLVDKDTSIVLATYYSDGPQNIKLEKPPYRSDIKELIKSTNVRVVNSLWDKILKQSNHEILYRRYVVRLIWGDDD